MKQLCSKEKNSTSCSLAARTLAGGAQFASNTYQKTTTTTNTLLLLMCRGWRLGRALATAYLLQPSDPIFSPRPTAFKPPSIRTGSTTHSARPNSAALPGWEKWVPVPKRLRTKLQASCVLVRTTLLFPRLVTTCTGTLTTSSLRTLCVGYSLRTQSFHADPLAWFELPRVQTGSALQPNSATSATHSAVCDLTDVWRAANSSRTVRASLFLNCRKSHKSFVEHDLPTRTMHAC